MIHIFRSQRNTCKILKYSYGLNMHYLKTKLLVFVGPFILYFHCLLLGPLKNAESKQREVINVLCLRISRPICII